MTLMYFFKKRHQKIIFPGLGSMSLKRYFTFFEQNVSEKKTRVDMTIMTKATDYQMQYKHWC